MHAWSIQKSASIEKDHDRIMRIWRNLLPQSKFILTDFVYTNIRLVINKDTILQPGISAAKHIHPWIMGIAK